MRVGSKRNAYVYILSLRAYIETANNNTTKFRFSAHHNCFVSKLDNDQLNTSDLHIEHNSQLLRTEEQRGEAFLSRFIEQCSQQHLQERREARSELDAVIGAGVEPAFTSQDPDEAIRRLSDTARGPGRLRFQGMSEDHRRSLLADINASIASGTVPDRQFSPNLVRTIAAWEGTG